MYVSSDLALCSLQQVKNWQHLPSHLNRSVVYDNTLYSNERTTRAWQTVYKCPTSCHSLFALIFSFSFFADELGALSALKLIFLFILPKNVSEEKCILYSLYGVVEHSGSMKGGHYVAYVKIRMPSKKVFENVSGGQHSSGQYFMCVLGSVHITFMASDLRIHQYMYNKRIPLTDAIQWCPSPLRSHCKRNYVLNNCILLLNSVVWNGIYYYTVPYLFMWYTDIYRPKGCCLGFCWAKVPLFLKMVAQDQPWHPWISG